LKTGEFFCSESCWIRFNSDSPEENPKNGTDEISLLGQNEVKNQAENAALEKNQGLIRAEKDKQESISKIWQEVYQQLLSEKEEELKIDLAEIGLSPQKITEEIRKLGSKEDIENYKNNLKKQISTKRDQKLSILKDKAIQTIREKLKKEGIELGNDWENQFQKTNSASAVAAFVQQMEKEITEKAQKLNIDNMPSTGKENKSLLYLGLGMLAISLGGLIAWFIFSRRKKSVKN
jgi:LPXTG-motif cell wall-anchored protein